MISTRIDSRKDGKSSASKALFYGQGLAIDKETGEYLIKDKAHRTRFGNFGLIEDGVYINPDVNDMIGIINMAAIEMQSNCDLNTRSDEKSKIAHFIVAFDQYEPPEAVLRDTEDSMLAAIGLDNNHFSTFLHSDNGHWHLHIFASRIEKSPPHRVSSLWEDQTKRDKVCREIEIRHGLKRDNGMHEITEDGKIVEIPLAERRAAREAKRESAPSISDKAKTTEIYSGEKTFQSWANEIRIGDRLKHAKSWKDLHAAAAAYNCEIRQKGAGLIICPIGETGGMALSKVGLKNLPSKFGAFQPAQPGKQTTEPEATYQPGPTDKKAKSHYQKWREARDDFQPMKTDRINEQRESHKTVRSQVVATQKAEIEKIRENRNGPDRIAALSVAKMDHTAALVELSDQLALERKALRAELAAAGPGNTFRDFLWQEAKKGDDAALGLARKYGIDESNDVLRKREADELQIVAAASGREHKPAQRLNFTYIIQRSGTVVYDFGQGRKVTDSAIAKQIQLNREAGNSPEAIATALRFATQKFGNTLTLTGSAEFQQLAVETAVRNGLHINFKDPTLQAYKQEFEASIKPKNLTPKQIQKGVEHVINSAPGRPPAPILARLAATGLGRVPGDRAANDVIRLEQPAARTTTDTTSRLHDVPVGKLDVARKVSGGVLPDAVPGRLGDSHAGEDPALRRTGTSAAGSTGSGRSADHDQTKAGSGASADHANDVADTARSTGRIGTSAGLQRGRPVRNGESAGNGRQGLSVTEAAAIASNHVDPAALVDAYPHQVAAPAQQPTSPQAPSPTQSKKSAQRAFGVPPALDSQQAEAVAAPEPAPVQQPLSAHAWLAEWAAETGRDIAMATPGNGDVGFSVVHVAKDGIVVNKGRSGAVYPVSNGPVLHVGDKVVVDRSGQLCPASVPGVGENDRER